MELLLEDFLPDITTLLVQKRDGHLPLLFRHGQKSQKEKCFSQKILWIMKYVYALLASWSCSRKFVFSQLSSTASYHKLPWLVSFFYFMI